MVLDKSFLYDKLKGIVGPENVTDKEIIMEAYTASIVWYAGLTERQIETPKKPDFIVRAGSTEEIQEIVRLANQYKVPIVPIGAFTGVYRGAVPLEGGIMLDMSRMKNIEIDEDIMTVTLEPGVNWAHAYRELAVKGYWISAQALPAYPSVLGSTTQAGAHLPMYKRASGGAYSTLTIGMEVVLPTGELLVTGSAALPRAKPARARAYGPDVGALFLGAQGTLGIVTKQTLPLWRIPEARHVVTGSFKDENFKGIVRAIRRIYDDQFEGPIWAEAIWGVYKGEAALKPWKRPGEWEFYVHLYGRKETVEYYREFAEKIIIEEGGTIGESEFPETETDYSAQMYEEAIYWRPRANSIILAGSTIDRNRITASAPDHKLPELYDAALGVLAKHGVPKSRLHTGLFRAGVRSQSFSLTYFYDLTDAEEVRRTEAINEEWARVTGTKRPQFVVGGYRPSPVAAKTLMPQLGEYYQLLKTLKRTLDPNRIMNPGKLMDL